MKRDFVRKTFIDISIITVSTLLLTFLIWLPHLLKVNFYNLDFSPGFDTIYRNFDGIEYIMIAKTFYQPNLMAQLPQSLPAIYYAAHFPAYAVLIFLITPLLGALKSMVLASLIFTILSAVSFYFLVRDFKLTVKPLFLSLVFLILPARWLIVHSVGSAEPIFIFLTITSLYLFMKYEQTLKARFIWLAGIFGLLAQLTRPPGILLFIALSVYILWKFYYLKEFTFVKRLKLAITSYYPLLLIPIGLLSVFSLYQLVYQDFFAYFHTGDNIHLTFPPFQVFNESQAWVGEIWLEDAIFVFLLGFLGALKLIKKRLYPIAAFVLIYLGASTLVAHRDISRYTLPIAPFILIAFEQVLISREFKIVLLILGLAIYLYSQNFLLANTAPFPNVHLFD